jgi:ferredoxin, 2Fe-2S
MARITYIEFSGVAHVVDVAAGLSVMEGAVKNNVPGIDAECGGAMACGTCHVYVDREWLEKTGPKSADEDQMIGFAVNIEDNSRLACQIKVTDALDGLVVRTPERQHD